MHPQPTTLPRALEYFTMDLTTVNKGLASRRHERQGLRARAPVAAHFEDCSQAIQQLSQSLHVQDSGTDLYRLARECTIRLNVWGHGSGASSRALDYELKDSPGLKQHILVLLDDLFESVESASAEARLQIRDDVTAVNSANVDANLLGDISEDDFGLHSDPLIFLEEAIDILKSLFRLLPTLQDPLEENHGATTDTDPAAYTEEEFEQVALMMFPKVHKKLAERLGHSNWCRRQNIWRLSGAQHDSMMPGPLKHKHQTDTTSWGTELRRLSKDPLSRLLTQRRPKGVDSDAELSTIISCADSQITVLPLGEQDSVSTFTDSSQPVGMLALEVPFPPVDLPREVPFDCPYCQTQLPLGISSTRFQMQDWNAHVFRDLKPYICTFGTCSDPRRLYSSRSDWFQHELNFHRSASEWICCVCDDGFNSSSLFSEHLYTAHPGLSETRIQILLESCKRFTVEQIYDTRCTICDAVCDTVGELEAHLGSHLEVYALSTLINREPEEDPSGGSDDMIAEYIQGLPELPDRQIGIQSATSLDLLDSARLPSSSVQGRLHPVAYEDWRSNNLIRNGSIQSDGDHLADWVDKVEKHNPEVSVSAEQQLPKRFENFVGRNVDLNSIHAHLELTGQICTISGRGGIGKTATAIEYLHKYKSEYSGVFWVEAETPGVCAEQFAAIIDSLNATGKVPANEDARVFQTREYLARSDRRWLIVFDNVPSWKSIARYVPRNFPRTQGSILITTRGALFPQVHRYQNQHDVELQPWCLPHGKQFLMTSIYPRLKEQDIEHHEDFPYAEQVLRVVGGLPLAVSMIVGYVKVSRCSLPDFLEMWEEKEHINRKKRRGVDIGETDIDSTIDSLWTIGIREVRMNSRRLLDIMSFLDPERIQKSLLVGDHQEEYLEWIHVSEALSFKRMINELLGRRLISAKESTTGPVYSIHRMLQQKILLDMEDYGFVDAFRKVFRLIRKWFPEANPQQVPSSRNWDTCQEYIPHVFTLHRIFLRNSANLMNLSDPTSIELANLFYDAGFYLWARQSTSYDGLEFLGTAETILRDAGDNFAPKTQADIHCLMGMLMLNIGVAERREALDRLHAAHMIRENVYAQEPTRDNEVLLQNARNDYALCLLDEHKFEEAGKLFVECRRRYLTWGTEDQNPFENSKYYGNFALVHMWRGDMSQAIKFQERSIELIEKFSGPTNAYWRKVFMLGCILLQNDDFQGALDKFLEVLTARLDILGQHHNETILATYAVGATYDHLGDPYTAIEYLQQCIDRVKRSKWDRAALARAQYHLARVYRKQDINHEKTAKLEAGAEVVLEEYGSYAAECVRRSGNKMMVLNDLQPTFLGRFTGLKLLKYLKLNLNTAGGQDTSMEQ